MRRTLRLVAIMCWGLALAPVVPATFGAAPGATLDAAGWWNRNQALPIQGDPTGLGVLPPAEVPPPPTVPEDGLHVANDASGASAIAAVRYKIDGQAGGTLTLRLAEGSTLTGTEEIVACPVQGGFEAAQNGRWDAKPSYDEAACILAATPTEAGDGLTFDVPATMASALGDISVVVVPAPGSTTPFSLAFARPADGDFVVTTPVVAAPASGGAVSSPAPAYSPGTPVYSAPQPSSPSFSAPSSPAVAAPAADAGGEATPSIPTTPTVAAIEAAEESRAPQLVAILTLLLVGAALWWLGSQPQRAPRLLGSVGGAASREADVPVAAATARPRGVGRFARIRTAAPNRL
jgi:hypothetical protein